MYTKFIQHLLRIDSMIKQEDTGSPRKLATKVGISERSLYGYLRLMKNLHAPIKFCPLRQTYYYDKKGKLIISFIPDTDDDDEFIKKKQLEVSRPL